MTMVKKYLYRKRKKKMLTRETFYKVIILNICLSTILNIFIVMMTGGGVSHFLAGLVGIGIGVFTVSLIYEVFLRD